MTLPVFMVSSFNICAFASAIIGKTICEGVLLRHRLYLCTFYSPTSVETYSAYRAYIQLYLIIGCMVICGYLIRRSFQQNRLAQYLLFAASLAVFGVVHDILNWSAALDQISFSHTPLSVILQSAVLSGRSALAHKRAEHLVKTCNARLSPKPSFEVATREAQDASRKKRRLMRSV